MEKASEKQINFMKNLKIEYPNGVTKDEARAMIDRVLNKSEKEAEDKIINRENNTSNGKEYHLSIEECRARALECSLKALDINNSLTGNEQNKIREAFFNWIWKGE